MRVKEKKGADGKIVLEVLATAAEVAEQFDQAAVTFAKQLQIMPDPNKTPQQAIAEKLGIDDVDSVLGANVFGALVPRAIDARGIIPAYPPNPSMVRPPKRGHAYEFSFEVLPKPTYELDSYEPVKIFAPPYELDEAEVDRQLEAMASQFSEYVAVEPHPVRKGDTCLVEIDASINGEHNNGLSTEGRPYTTGGGFMPDGFDENIIGMDVGETKTFTFEGPGFDEDGNPSVDVVECTVTVKEIQEKRPAQMSDEWLSRNMPMFENVDALRANIRKSVDAQNRLAYENYKRTLAAAELAKRLHATIPNEVYEATAGSLSASLRADIERQGGNWDDYVNEQGGERQLGMMLMLQSRQNLQQGYALDALYRHENLSYTDEDINEVCQSVNPGNPQAVRESMERTGRYALTEAAQRLCAGKWLVEHSEVIERAKE